MIESATSTTHTVVDITTPSPPQDASKLENIFVSYILI